MTNKDISVPTCERVHVDPDSQHLLDIIDRYMTENTRLKTRLTNLRTVLRMMAHEDWRGNKPAHIAFAERALAADDHSPKDPQ